MYNPNQYVYLLKCEKFYKIGYSFNPERRASSIGTATPFEVKLLGFKSYPHEEEARRVERSLHKKYKKYRCKGEWFKNIPGSNLDKKLAIEFDLDDGQFYERQLDVINGFKKINLDKSFDKLNRSEDYRLFCSRLGIWEELLNKISSPPKTKFYKCRLRITHMDKSLVRYKSSIIYYKKLSRGISSLCYDILKCIYTRSYYYGKWHLGYENNHAININPNGTLSIIFYYEDRKSYDVIPCAKIEIEVLSAY